MKKTKEEKMVTLWSGKTRFFDEIVDAVACAGIPWKVDKEKFIVEVPESRYTEGYGILMDLNTFFGAGW
jgi:hypothetical protein